MKLPSLLLLAYLSSLALAASSWGFTDATVAIHGKGSGVGGIKEKYSAFNASSATCSNFLQAFP
jgi:hypothetical protein